MAGNNQDTNNTPSYVNDTAIQAANQKVQDAQNSGNQAQVDSGMKELSGALLDQGIVYPSNEARAAAQAHHASLPNQAQTPQSSTGGSTVVLTGDVEKDDAAREERIKGKQSSRAQSAVSSMTANTAQIHAAAQEQQKKQIDYAVNQGVKELERAEEDAQKQFQTQQNQVDIDEAKALDNQALYAEARGDRGGIGQAQYGQIQATAMNNRRAINTARTELATATARQIADLRAQGEFQKADALLQLTQTYLAQLNEIQMWGAEFALQEDQFNAQLEQWAASFKLQQEQFQEQKNQFALDFGLRKDQFLESQKYNAATLAIQEAGLTGMYKGEKTWEVQREELANLADAGIAAAQAGYELSPEQKAAVKSMYGYGDDWIAALALDVKSEKEKAEALPIAQNALTVLQSGYEITDEQRAALWTAYRMGDAQIAAIQSDAANARSADAAATVAQTALSLIQQGLSVSKEQEEALWTVYRIGSSQISAIRNAALAGGKTGSPANPTKPDAAPEAPKPTPAASVDAWATASLANGTPAAVVRDTVWGAVDAGTIKPSDAYVILRQTMPQPATHGVSDLMWSK